jgi:4'-phosphopantetheinyl transferase EntD
MPPAQHQARTGGAAVTATFDPLLQSAIEAIDLPGIVISHRLISAGDEHALLPQEAPAFASSVDRVRRASGAARIVARQLLASLGYPECPIPRAPSGAPVWPAGVIGSLAHDSRVAIATVGLADEVAALGIDIEPAEILPPELLELVATPEERLKIGEDPFRGRLLFVAKEAVYKAVYPLDRQFLDHHDVQINFAERKAHIHSGRVVDIRVLRAAHLVALAFIRQPQ